MSEGTKLGSLFSQIFVGVAVAVITAVIIDRIGIKSPDEQTGEEKGDKIAKTAQPFNSRDDQASRQNSNTPIQTNPQNYSEPKTNESKGENYGSYINTPSSRSNVSVTVVDENGNLSTSTSSAIADIYRELGRSTSTGLIRSAFVRKPEFRELREGNSEIIEKLRLDSYVDYLAIGKIEYSIRPGKLVDGTVICTASISMSIISTNNRSIEQSFTISNATGNGATESQAQENAFQKLLEKYRREHSSL